LWLLSDENGDVNLNVPVRGDLNDPEIDVWKLVWSTLRNKITDTANDPVQSLAPLVGADPKDLQAIEFEYTDSIPSDEHCQQLDWLLELEKKKEGLPIDLEYFVDDDLQKKALSGSGEEETADSTSAASEELSIKYSAARIGSIRKYLDSLSSDTRIQLKDRDSLAPSNTGAMPYFKINFSLETETDSISD
jgi:hypothetical protein